MYIRMDGKCLYRRREKKYHHIAAPRTWLMLANKAILLSLLQSTVVGTTSARAFVAGAVTRRQTRRKSGSFENSCDRCGHCHGDEINEAQFQLRMSFGVKLQRDKIASERDRLTD